MFEKRHEGACEVGTRIETEDKVDPKESMEDEGEGRLVADAAKFEMDGRRRRGLVEPVEVVPRLAEEQNTEECSSLKSSRNQFYVVMMPLRSGR